jgi:hypothetical protein
MNHGEFSSGYVLSLMFCGSQGTDIVLQNPKITQGLDAARREGPDRAQHYFTNEMLPRSASPTYVDNVGHLHDHPNLTW